MNREFRLALLRNWTRDGPPMAIDFTRYDLKAQEPEDLQREWSLMNVLNQKGTRPAGQADAPGAVERRKTSAGSLRAIRSLKKLA